MVGNYNDIFGKLFEVIFTDKIFGNNLRYFFC